MCLPRCLSVLEFVLKPVRVLVPVPVPVPLPLPLPVQLSAPVLMPVRQRGAALITAMLLAALITILAASWLARFDSHLRVTEVQRMGTQARWLLRAATDWARMIISEDTSAYDDLTEVWAVPIAPIRMTDIAGAQEAYFSGRLQDAQGLFNLHTLREGTVPVDAAIARVWGSALMQSQGLNAAQAAAWVAGVQAMPESSVSAAQWFDTLPAGVSPAVKAKLESQFIWLPERTRVNINTATEPVLAAHPSIGASTAQQLISTRSRAPVRDPANIANAFGLPMAVAGQFSINTRYFLATGRLAVGRIDVMARSLMQRQTGGPPKLLWSQPL
jgi:general secretion pathway protein K